MTSPGQASPPVSYIVSIGFLVLNLHTSHELKFFIQRCLKADVATALWYNFQGFIIIDPCCWETYEIFDVALLIQKIQQPPERIYGTTRIVFAKLVDILGQQDYVASIIVLGKAKVLVIHVVKDVSIPTNISVGLCHQQRLSCTVGTTWTVNWLETFPFFLLLCSDIVSRYAITTWGIVSGGHHEPAAAWTIS